MLFKRYANPLPLLDGMIKGRRFAAFVNEFVTITNEELEDKTLWEFWLHKNFDLTYGEFLEQAKSHKPEKHPSQDEIETTVKGSAELLNGFHLS